MQIRYLPVILCMLASCGKKSGVCDMPPVLDNITHNFTVRDSAGKHMIREDPRLDISKLQVIQPCDPEFSSFVHDKHTGIIQIIARVGPYKGMECNTVYLKWDDVDTDTLTYEYTTDVGYCATTYQTTSFRFNGRVAIQDTVYGKQPDNKILVLQK